MEDVNSFRLRQNRHYTVYTHIHWIYTQTSHLIVKFFKSWYSSQNFQVPSPFSQLIFFQTALILTGKDFPYHFPFVHVIFFPTVLIFPSPLKTWYPTPKDLITPSHEGNRELYTPQLSFLFPLPNSSSFLPPHDVLPPSISLDKTIKAPVWFLNVRPCRILARWHIMEILAIGI